MTKGSGRFTYNGISVAKILSNDCPPNYEGETHLDLEELCPAPEEDCVKAFQHMQRTRTDENPIEAYVNDLTGFAVNPGRFGTLSGLEGEDIFDTG